MPVLLITSRPSTVRTCRSRTSTGSALFDPRESHYARAENILDTYHFFTSEAGGKKGAVMLGDEMIDEISRKMALVISARGRAAAITRQDNGEKPTA